MIELEGAEHNMRSGQAYIILDLNLTPCCIDPKLICLYFDVYVFRFTMNYEEVTKMIRSCIVTEKKGMPLRMLRRE